MMDGIALELAVMVHIEEQDEITHGEFSQRFGLSDDAARPYIRRCKDRGWLEQCDDRTYTITI